MMEEMTIFSSSSSFGKGNDEEMEERQKGPMLDKAPTVQENKLIEAC